MYPPCCPACFISHPSLVFLDCVLLVVHLLHNQTRGPLNTRGTMQDRSSVVTLLSFSFSFSFFLFLFSLPHSFPLLMISRFSGQITGPFDAELVKALPNSLAYICHNGAGYDNIDTTACSERGQSHGILGFCCWRLPSAAIGATRLTGKQESASQAHQLPSTMLPQISQCF